ncbi:hypothetical protein MKD41_06310 [Lutibacter sp. A64]|uniref:hypothetical protein n=1 Tax=Lutibacter sp. A64 TaxID=2918526 RepID=UPI001F057BB4|nr:hypothetical protein [Lutibacter sp. A64]UMB55084.1 hypothetical protein MKD41_06310 [Lutibacter sp. A64]
MTTLKSTYRIISDLNLILECHGGSLDVNSYIKFKQKLFNDVNFKTGLNHFIHFRNTIFINPEEDLIKFVDFIKNNTSKLGERKVAFVTSTPSHVVTTTIYNSLLSDVKQQVSVFSTNNAAFNWLIVHPLNINELNTIVNTMEKEVTE